MKLPLLCTALALALCGCAQLRVVASNERTVIIEADGNGAASALALANSTCAKSGRFARYLYRTNNGPGVFNYHYDCIV